MTLFLSLNLRFNKRSNFYNQYKKLIVFTKPVKSYKTRFLPSLFIYNLYTIEIYAPPWGLSTLAKEFSAAARKMQSSSNELNTLVSDRV